MKKNNSKNFIKIIKFNYYIYINNFKEKMINRKNYLNNNIIINILVFLQLIVNIILDDCPRNNPILLKSGLCISLNCSEEEFETNYCKINNPIIKTQWLTSIIAFGDLDFRYINFITYSNGDLVVETTSYPGGPKRMFYGLKKNGRNLFKEDTPFYSITAQNQDNNGIKYESEIFIIKLNSGADKSKEYIVSMSKSESFAELYDFDNNKIYQRKLRNITWVTHENLRQASLTITSSDNKYYSLYGFINEGKFYLYKFFFSTINDIEEGLSRNMTTINDVIGLSVTCFQTDQKIIICFYTSNTNDKVIYAQDLNFNKKGQFEISPRFNITDETSFIKCIHLTGEIGVFSFYDTVNYQGGLYPFIYFKKYIDIGNSLGSFENPITSLHWQYVILDFFNFTTNTLMNDLTKISDSKICFTSTDDEHETLFIVVLHIIELREIKIRYYTFEIYDLLYYKFLHELKSYTYNQFVVIGASVCRQKNCINEFEDPHFSSLLFLSYPNSTDEDFEVSEYLFNNNSIKIEYLELDLKNYIKIENNIFGFILHGIQIFNISNNNIIKLYSFQSGNIINENYILKVDETIKIHFKNKHYYKDNCSFYYYSIVTEPERDIFDTYPFDIELFFGNDTEEYFNSHRNLYIGRTSFFNIHLKYNLDSDCSNDCSLCLKDNPDFCITCNHSYYFELNDNKTKAKKCLINCSIEEIINNLCKNEEINNEKSEEIYKTIKKECLNYECAIQNKIIETKNIIFQISTLEAQKNDTYSIASNIDLGKCEDKLREQYNIKDEDDILIIKRDIRNELTIYVEYELYKLKDLEQLNLDICNKTNITIIIPVNLENETESLYNSLYQYGYNLFNPNDSFYNDICTPYTTDNGTDILLDDRKEDIYKSNGNITLCQAGCEFELYNLENKKATCKCSIQKYNYINNASIDISTKFDKKEFNENFLKTLKNSNFMVLKCYKLVFTFDNILKNIGRFVLAIIFLIIILLITVCNLYEIRKINIFIQGILRVKNNNVNEEKVKRIITHHPKSIRIIHKVKKEKSSINYPPRRSNNSNIYKSGKKFSRKEKKNSKTVRFDNNSIINNSSKRNISDIKQTFNNFIARRKTKSKTERPKPNLLSELKKIKPSEHILYNDRELNSVDYNDALKYDKRTYFQYYLSLLLQKHLILSTFFVINDYNLYTLKTILFLLSFCLYFSVNGFFFSDETMHKIYKERGVYNILFQIPQIIYSSLASGVIKSILKKLSLSEKNILEIKKEKNPFVAYNISKRVRICLNFKFILFYILSVLFMIFFWYFISCFCAVFSNTQIILIKDTLISFGLSMIYPFGLNLLPGIFRIPSLKSKNKDKECLYKFSKVVAII